MGDTTASVKQILDSMPDKAIGLLVGSGSVLIGAAFGLWRKFFKKEWEAKESTSVAQHNAQKELLDFWKDVATKLKEDIVKLKEDFQKEKDQFRKDIDELRSKNTSLTETSIEHLTKISISEADAKNYQRRVDTLTKELEEIKTKLENTADEVLEKVLIIEDLNGEKAALTAFVQHLQTELAVIQEQLLALLEKQSHQRYEF